MIMSITKMNTVVRPYSFLPNYIRDKIFSSENFINYYLQIMRLIIIY